VKTPKLSGPGDSDSPVSEHKVVLLVDDTPENLTILIDLLGRDFRVLVAESGESALDQLQHTQPDIILLDVLMPNGIDGFETYRRIRRIPKCMHTPIVFLSALDDLTHRVGGFDLGAVDYIAKPFYPEEVRARVESHSRRSSYQSRLEYRNHLLIREIELQKAIQVEIEQRMQVGVMVTVKHAVWQIEFCSDLARQLFKKHYDLWLTEVLPEALQQSIEHSSQSTWSIPNRSGRLLTSFYSIWKQAFLITFEEQSRASNASPDALYSLGLTRREAEVLFWIAEGKTSPEIAVIIGAAPTTIKKHVNHILEKLAVENRLSAALMANEILRSEGHLSDTTIKSAPRKRSSPG
jgi:DNA-binding response OmpR family regulator/DNA-binding CsgD family transcriptional regulator